MSEMQEHKTKPINKEARIYVASYAQPILGLGMMGGRNCNILRVKSGDVFGKADGDEVWLYFLDRADLMDFRDAIEAHLDRDSPREKDWPKRFATKWTL